MSRKSDENQDSIFLMLMSFKESCDGTKEHEKKPKQDK
jgi:hypothetical protein